MSNALDRAILWPLVAQVAVVAMVWLRMYRERVGEMLQKRISAQQVATSRQAALLQNVAAADNFRNLFEVPVLFFAVCLALAVTGLSSALQVALAWAFVTLRGVHSLIHVTYNRVMHRFAAYTASTICLFTMWVLFAVSLARSSP